MYEICKKINLIEVEDVNGHRVIIPTSKILALREIFDQSEEDVVRTEIILGSGVSIYAKEGIRFILNNMPDLAQSSWRT